MVSSFLRRRQAICVTESGRYAANRLPQPLTATQPSSFSPPDSPSKNVARDAADGVAALWRLFGKIDLIVLSAVDHVLTVTAVPQLQSDSAARIAWTDACGRPNLNPWIQR